MRSSIAASGENPHWARNNLDWAQKNLRPVQMNLLWVQDFLHPMRINPHTA